MAQLDVPPQDPLPSLLSRAGLQVLVARPSPAPQLRAEVPPWCPELTQLELRFPEASLTMKGLDSWSLQGMVGWGGPCTESPQASHPGSLWGVLPRAFDLLPGTGEGCVFLQVYSLLVYLLYLLSLLFGLKISMWMCNRTGVPGSLHLPPGSPVVGTFSWVLLSKTEKGEGVLFGNKESKSWSQDQWPGLSVSLQAQPGWHAPPPSVSSRSTRKPKLTSFPPKLGLT